MSIIFRSTFSKLRECATNQIRPLCTAVAQSTAPILNIQHYPDEDRLYQKVRQIWIENFDTIEEKKIGLMSLHPDVFAARPRFDIIKDNIRWQKFYRLVTYKHEKTRAECKGGGRKPWPQKGTGRARHGSIRSPLFLRGGQAHPERAFTTFFYMLTFYQRVWGLISSLTVKLAQDDLHVVKDLEIPTKDPSYIEELLDKRKWGPSVLFVNVEDIMPENITMATDPIKHVNLMPLYGLNVHSMMKHDTLVLTEEAIKSLEEKLLFHLHRSDSLKLMKPFEVNQQ